MGKSTISMAIFHCYVSSPEGIHIYRNPHMPWFPKDLLTSAARSRCRFCRSSSASCTRRPWSRQRDSDRAGRKGGEMILKWWKKMEQMERTWEKMGNMVENRWETYGKRWETWWKKMENIWEKMGNMVEKDGKHMGKDAKWWEHDWKTWETDGNICVKLLCLILWKREFTLSWSWKCLLMANLKEHERLGWLFLGRLMDQWSVGCAGCA